MSWLFSQALVAVEMGFNTCNLQALPINPRHLYLSRTGLNLRLYPPAPIPIQ
jgi:hypothetical protein